MRWRDRFRYAANVMSACGTKRTFHLFGSMSALEGKADISTWPLSPTDWVSRREAKIVVYNLPVNRCFKRASNACVYSRAVDFLFEYSDS